MISAPHPTARLNENETNLRQQAAQRGENWNVNNPLYQQHEQNREAAFQQNIADVKNLEQSIRQRAAHKLAEATRAQNQLNNAPRNIFGRRKLQDEDLDEEEEEEVVVVEEEDMPFF